MKLLVDFDHCLAPFDHDTAAEKVKQELVKIVGKRGEIAGTEFSGIFYKMLSILHDTQSSDIIALNAAINALPVRRPDGLNEIDQKWSRELWLQYLSDKHRLDLDGRTITMLVEKYWETLAAHCKLYPDAVDFLKKFGGDVFVITGSDDRMIFRGDSMIYDPALSEKKKIERLEGQGLRKFLPSGHIITADPYGKTTGEFWKKVMSRAGISRAQDGIIIEDSLSVIRAGVKLGFKTCILDRESFYNKENVADETDSYITNLREFKLPA